jgi:hypothetical protein
MGSMAERHDAHAGESMVGPHGAADDHGADHGHDDHNMGEGHETADLGPIDVQSWGAALLGIALGLVVLIALIQAVS